MGSWFKNLFQKPSAERKKLHFKDSDGAFEYACRYMTCNVEPGEVLPVLVQQVWHKEGGMDDLAICVASEHPITAVTYAPTNLGLRPGDLVGFRIMMIRPPPAGLFGVSEVLLEPSYDLAEQAWVTKRVLFHGRSG